VLLLPMRLWAEISWRQRRQVMAGHCANGGMICEPRRKNAPSADWLPRCRCLARACTFRRHYAGRSRVAAARLGASGGWRLAAWLALEWLRVGCRLPADVGN